jgi:hypothetical protein
MHKATLSHFEVKRFPSPPTPPPPAGRQDDTLRLRVDAPNRVRMAHEVSASLAIASVGRSWLVMASGG